MPVAMPLTTPTPAAASSRPRLPATSMPYADARRAPTTAAAQAVRFSLSRSRAPRTKTTAGGAGRSRSASGYRSSQRQTALTPDATQPARASRALSCAREALYGPAVHLPVAPRRRPVQARHLPLAGHHDPRPDLGRGHRRSRAQRVLGRPRDVDDEIHAVEERTAQLPRVPAKVGLAA